MRARILVLLTLLPPSLGACAAHQDPGEIGSDPKDFAVVVPGDAEWIPLYTAHGVPGCRHRVAGDVTANSLLGLRDEAHQKLADAVIDVRRRIEAPQPRRSAAEPLTPIPTYYTGTAVRFVTPGCRNAQQPYDAMPS